MFILIFEKFIYKKYYKDLFLILEEIFSITKLKIKNYSIFIIYK